LSQIIAAGDSGRFEDEGRVEGSGVVGWWLVGWWVVEWWVAGWWGSGWLQLMEH